jgi:hypothetical protein
MVVKHPVSVTFLMVSAPVSALDPESRKRVSPYMNKQLF